MSRYVLKVELEAPQAEAKALDAQQNIVKNACRREKNDEWCMAGLQHGAFVVLEKIMKFFARSHQLLTLFFYLRVFSFCVVSVCDTCMTGCYVVLGCCCFNTALNHTMNCQPKL